MKKFDQLTKDNFDENAKELWDEVMEEGKKVRKLQKTCNAIKIFSHLILAVVLLLLSCVATEIVMIVFEDPLTSFVREIGGYLLGFLPDSMTLTVKAILLSAVALVIPFLFCIVVRVFCNFIKTDYSNEDFGKTGKAGAIAMKKAFDTFCKNLWSVDCLIDSYKINFLFSSALTIPFVLHLLIISPSAKNMSSTEKYIVCLVVLVAGVAVLSVLCYLIKIISIGLCKTLCGSNKQSAEYLGVTKKLDKCISCFEEEENKQRQINEAIRRRESEERRKRNLEERLLEGKKIYEEAIKQEEVDKNLIFRAADVGDIDACVYIGSQFISDYHSNLYTKEEKEQQAKLTARIIKEALSIAKELGHKANDECEFLLTYARVRFESNNKNEWQNILRTLRKFQNNKEICEKYGDSLKDVISVVVNTIDGLCEETNQNLYPEKHKELTCRFMNGAICTKLSSTYCVVHCEYYRRPDDCPTALMNKGLIYR